MSRLLSSCSLYKHQQLASGPGIQASCALCFVLFEIIIVSAYKLRLFFQYNMYRRASGCKSLLIWRVGGTWPRKSLDFLGFWEVTQYPVGWVCFITLCNPPQVVPMTLLFTSLVPVSTVHFSWISYYITVKYSLLPPLCLRCFVDLRQFILILQGPLRLALIFYVSKPDPALRHRIYYFILCGAHVWGSLIILITAETLYPVIQPSVTSQYLTVTLWFNHPAICYLFKTSQPHSTRLTSICYHKVHFI